ncbi:MAG: S-layer homology domain-containing protein, partial [Firmicutes bacterium]|nr:S-layer homology domain-containing protein [Bacillota bacterium]
EKGITSGKTKTLFGPDDPCTRAQIVTFLYLSFAE